MKATFKKILPLIAAVLFATSCSKDDNNESDVVVNNGPTTEVSNEQGTTDDIVTFPFSVKVSTGNSLSKIAFSGKEGTSEYTVQFDDEVDLGKKLTVTAVPEEGKDYSDVTGELVLRKDEEGKYWFDGSISASTNATALKDGTIQLTGSFEGGEVFSGYKISHESLGDLMNDKDVKHKFLAKEFNFKSTEIMLLDQVAYFCIEVAETQEKFDLTIGETTETFTSKTQKKFWIAVSVGTVVKGNLISKSGKTAEAGKIYKVNRTNDVDLGLSVLWKNTNEAGYDEEGWSILYNQSDKETSPYKDEYYFDWNYAGGDGHPYRLPSKAELEDLANFANNIYWGTWNGMVCKIFSNEYGELFFPAAGGGGGGDAGNSGAYWSSEEARYPFVYYLYFEKESASFQTINPITFTRYLSTRLVRDL